MAFYVDFHNFRLSSLAGILIVLCALISLGAAYTLYGVVYNVFFHPLRKFPGPWSFAATRIPWVLSAISGRLPYTVAELHEKYGDVVRTAPDELSFISSSAWKDIYGFRPGHETMKKDMASYTNHVKNSNSLFTTQSDTDHGRMRRTLAHAFSEKAMREQETLIMQHVDLLIQRLHENAGPKPLDIGMWLNFTTFDLIGDLAFGEPFECLEKSVYNPWVYSVLSTTRGSVFMSASKRFPPFEPILKHFIPKGLLAKRQDHVKQTQHMLARRLATETDRHDFLSYILRHSGKDSGMSQLEMLTTSTLLVRAGSESTATLLTGATFFLMQNPHVLKTLTAEIRNTFANESEINLISVNSLKYQLAVLDETLRMYPPVPTGLPRRVPGDGAMISGHWVAGGTCVSVGQYATYHSKTHFQAPEEFVPERWLGDPRFETDKRAAVQPFSMGPRNCLGRNLAYAEMRLILARILWNFDLEKPDEVDRTWLEGQKIYNVWNKPPLPVKLVPVIRG